MTNAVPLPEKIDTDHIYRQYNIIFKNESAKPIYKMKEISTTE